MGVECKRHRQDAEWVTGEGPGAHSMCENARGRLQALVWHFSHICGTYGTPHSTFAPNHMQTPLTSTPSCSWVSVQKS